MPRAPAMERLLMLLTGGGADKGNAILSLLLTIYASLRRY